MFHMVPDETHYGDKETSENLLCNLSGLLVPVVMVCVLKPKDRAIEEARTLATMMKGLGERELRGALLGTGDISECHVIAWQTFPDVKIVALSNRTRVRAGAIGRRFGMPDEHTYTRPGHKYRVMNNEPHRIGIRRGGPVPLGCHTTVQRHPYGNGRLYPCRSAHAG